MGFGDWIKRFMKKHKITQSKLSKKTGFSPNIIYFWHSGRNLPNGYSIAILSTALSSITGIKRKDILEEMVVAILKS